MLALALPAGCGRIGFDPGRTDGSTETGDSPGDSPLVACIPMGHDEDGDGIDDTCDVCPHIPDMAQADADGDRVGDLCDPEPTNPRQQIVRFDGFASLDPAYELLGPVTVSADQLALDSVTNASAMGILLHSAPTHDLWIVGGRTKTTTNTAVLGLFAGAYVGPQTYYCELFDDGTDTTLQFTYTSDGTNFMHQGAIVTTNRLANGSGTFAFDISPTTDHCQSTWHGEMRSNTATTPQGFANEVTELFVTGVDARFDYFIDIRTN